MESSHGLHVLEFIENEFNKLTENPEIYVEPQLEKADRFKQLSEKSYRTAFCNTKNYKGRFLPKLLIDGFDAEQIWQQCELLNKAVLPKVSQAVHSVHSKDIINTISKAKQPPTTSTDNYNKNTRENEDNAFSTDESGAEEEYAFDDDSDSPTEMDSTKKRSNKEKISADEVSNISSENEEDVSNDGSNAEEEYAFDDDSDTPTEMDTVENKKLPVKEKIKSGFSQVDDKFFKLSELEEYLKIEDLKEERKYDRDSNEDDIDLFEDIPSDDMADIDEEGVASKKSSKDLMYKDFFDDPESRGKDASSDYLDNQNDSMMEENDETFFNETDCAVDTKDLEENDISDEEKEIQEKNKNIKKSAFELQQEKNRKQILEVEKSMIEPQPWHLTGEVDASKRPTDSLIHKETDFDSNAKEEDFSVAYEHYEKIIKMAIRNKAFNDVIRKCKPTEDIIKYKKEVALEQTKSKKGLAEVYEEEYLKKQSKQGEEEEDPKHKEIKKLMDSLFPELYALFSHIPMPAVPELKVVSNLPAVTVEEVAPTKVSDATLLAPEEVKKKSGQIKSQTERTETDRKRERRKKKVHQKLKEKKRLQKLESQAGKSSAKVTKLEKLQTLKKLRQHKNTKIATVDDTGKIKSSKDFFSRLQDTMASKNKSKAQNILTKKGSSCI